MTRKKPKNAPKNGTFETLRINRGPIPYGGQSRTEQNAKKPSRISLTVREKWRFLILRNSHFLGF